jgi:L-alanine-DL-glutamate epimerase-like enolase superfamily enzyme
MRITKLDLLQADGLWRPFSFLKMSTDSGLTGWSEFVENDWAPGLRDVILALSRNLAGRDPRQFARLSFEMHALTQFTAGGLVHQAIGAIENACIDIAAKAAGVAACQLFGGPLRTDVALYWSHCGSFRASHAEAFERVLGTPRLRSLQDFEALGREAVARGFGSVKTNPVVFGAAGPQLLNPGFRVRGLNPERHVDEATLTAICDQAQALRSGLGADRSMMIDFNFGFRPDSLLRLARALEPTRPAWLEMDLHSPAALADVRRGARVPIASLESQYGRRDYAPWLTAAAVDTAIIDVPWNGFAESVRIAALAEVHEVNCAPHNFYGPLADLMSAQFCAAVPNVALMEIEADDVPWKYKLLTRQPVIGDGRFQLPAGPGWGADINEDAVAVHPWRGPG